MISRLRTTSDRRLIPPACLKLAFSDPQIAPQSKPVTVNDVARSRSPHTKELAFSDREAGPDEERLG
jgi:hypothetical protein